MNVSEIIRELDKLTSWQEVVVCLPGLLIFTVWLNLTSFGRLALADSAPRRNSMPAYLPFVPMVIWLGAIAVATLLKETLLTGLTEWQDKFIGHVLLCLGAGAGMAVIIPLVRVHFAGGLRGFGLRAKGILKDLAMAVVNLMTIYPLVTIALLMTLFFGKLFWGAQFDMPRHDELMLLGEQSPVSLKVLISVVTIVVMPVFEEMLFRGMFQTMIRSFLSELRFKAGDCGNRQSVWVAIALTSVLFAAIHGNREHWPALFVLAMCLGYAYEKSGSLMRPIFIHAMFNAISVIFTLLQNA
jgi:membrane protease YdiL (CAAX protease family)